MVILVDEHDKAIGEMEKMQAHRLGLLHRAFSVFILNNKGQILLQQRAFSKYHSGGLWTNTCCSHPFPGEEIRQAAERRLQEEMGIGNVSLIHSGSFIYKADLDQGLIEHEFDHVFYGYCDNDPVLNREEAEAFRWINPGELRRELNDNPEQFTVWFRIIAEKALLPF